MQNTLFLQLWWPTMSKLFLLYLRNIIVKQWAAPSHEYTRCFCVCLSVCLSIYLSVCLSVCLTIPICLLAFLFVCQPSCMILPRFILVRIVCLSEFRLSPSLSERPIHKLTHPHAHLLSLMLPSDMLRKSPKLLSTKSRKHCVYHRGSICCA